MRVFFGGIVGCLVGQMLEKSHILHKEIPQPQPPYLLPSQITIEIAKERRGDNSDEGGVTENNVANAALTKGRHPSPPQHRHPKLRGRQRGHDDVNILIVQGGGQQHQHRGDGGGSVLPWGSTTTATVRRQQQFDNHGGNIAHG